jgi:malate dehydrogenase
MRKKVAVIGAGFVGTMVAQRIAERNLADVVLADIVEGLPQGKALDIRQAGTLEGMDVAVTGTNDFSLVKGCDMVVFTAGFPRTPGMTREELALKNGGIVRSVVKDLAEYAPETMILMVTNPLDVMTHLAWKVSGFPPSRVFGMGGVLDSARYRLFLSDAVGISARDIEALVLGSHGDTMVPVDGYTTVKGVPILRFLGREKLDAVIERTRNGGAEIVKLLRTGSAWHAPSASVVAMVEAVLRDSGRMFPVSAYVDGQYGIRGIHVGVPVRLGAGGVEAVYEIPLAEGELEALRRSADVVQKTFDGIWKQG